MKRKFFYSLCTFLFCHTLVAAQAKKDTTKKEKPYFNLSLNYNSNLNFYGRTDSLRSTGFFPMAELWVTSKFYINVAPIFVNNKLQRFEYAGTTATAGYQKITEKWFTSVYALKPIYIQSSQLVQSALKGQTGASLSKLNKKINLTLGADLKFSNRTDVGATAGIDHLIRIENKHGVFIINPSFYVNAGTQQFSHTYTQKKKGRSAQQATQSVNKFNVLAYEFSVPLIYAKKAWQVLLTPAYVLPQNLITVPNRPDLSETGNNTFYTTLTVKRRFR